MTRALITLRLDEQAVLERLTTEWQTPREMGVSIDSCHSLFQRGRCERYITQDSQLRYVPSYRLPSGRGR